MREETCPGWPKFQAFLRDNGFSQAEAARALHVARSTITLWKKVAPDGARRRAIAIWTRGEVTESAWDTDEERGYLDAIRPARRKKRGAEKASAEERTLPLRYDRAKS